MGVCVLHVGGGQRCPRSCSGNPVQVHRRHASIKPRGYCKMCSRVQRCCCGSSKVETGDVLQPALLLCSMQGARGWIGVQGDGSIATGPFTRPFEA